MSEQMQVSENEHGLVRLFTIDLPADQISAFTDPDYDADEDDPPWALKQALGTRYLDRDFIEAFPLTNLSGLGLSGYLTQGLGIAEDDIAPDRARLDAQTGHLLVVLSSAFGGFAQTLTPRAPLQWLGTYVEEPARKDHAPLLSDTAHGDTDPAPGKAAKKPVSDAAMSGRVATVALIVMFALMGLMIWIAG